MGSYLNPGAAGFRQSRNSQIYIDKSGLIASTNAVLHTEQKYMCVSRPRRFGKSMAMNMLSAYYSCGEDTHALFDDLKIAGHASYKKHINQYHVIQLNMQEFLSITRDVDQMLCDIEKRLLTELHRIYPEYTSEASLVYAMKDIYAYTGIAFVILLDEWDCIFREYRDDQKAQKRYLDFLRLWLKDQSYVALAYMTGILPIKKYGTHSALNMFTEYSMTDPGELAPFFGFVDKEVQALCRQYCMNFEECSSWYDGYMLQTLAPGKTINYSMYSPKSVVEAMLRHKFGTYWNRTETYEALKIYIQLNMDGLKDAIVKMIAGESVSINTGTFVNDMVTFAAKDDVLTLLVHLGYLNFNAENSTVSIPNKEVSQEYINAIRTMDWHEVARSVEASHKLLESLWAQDGNAVAAALDLAHEEISILQYNDENSLSCAINLAFYAAKEYYTIVRELPAGKGFADICLIPRQLHADKPAAVIELKYNRSAEGAIAQIKAKQYADALKDYHGNLMLCGINYDRETKKHTCMIEKLEIG